MQKEFDDKNKDALAKVQDEFGQFVQAMRKARQDKDREALLKARGQYTELYKSFQKLSGDFEPKLKEIFNDDQKKKWEDVKNESPIPPGLFRPDKDGKKN